MSEETAFLEALKSEPANDTTRLIYADWLDEHGSLKSRYLRLVCELARLPQEEMLGSLLHDEMFALTPVVNHDWQQAVGRRFEVALLEYSPRDRYTLSFVFAELLGSGQNEAEDLVASVPTYIRSPLTYADAIFLYTDWLKFLPRFQIRPKVVVRPIPSPAVSSQCKFDLILRRLPTEFWPNWPIYKIPVAAFFGVGTREAADRIRQLPTVIFRSIQWSDVEPANRRIRQAFNRAGAELLPSDAISVVSHPPQNQVTLVG
jgi:uncharacterized protein (TIGR02996 family)